MSSHTQTPPDATPTKPLTDAPEVPQPPVCTPEQEANGTCIPPVRNPETPAES